MAGPLNNNRMRILTLVLVAQALGLFVISRRESVPLARSLDQFPRELAGWTMAQQGSIEKDVMDVLRADDVLTRVYAEPATRRAASLFIAYFKSQRSGQAPHSPKNCLPGSGWVPSESDIVAIPIPGMSEPIRVNRYIVSKGEDKSVVLYWYQAHNRVIASEYRAKIYLVADAIRYNRTDTALVRVVVPVDGDRTDTATQTAIAFTQSFFTPLRQFLPN